MHLLNVCFIAVLLITKAHCSNNCLTTTNNEYFNHITVKVYHGTIPITHIQVDDIHKDGNAMNATEIVIEEETIPVLKTGSFSDLLQLKYLYLKRNKIETIEEYAFHNLPRLRLLKLNFNNFKEVTRNIFANLTISTLSMKGCGIETLHTRAFYNLSQLHTLDLSSNNIEEIPVWLFYLTPNLRILNLNYNRLTTPQIPDSYFLDGFQTLNKHEYSSLDLSFNNYSSIDEMYFKGIRGFTELLLKGNNIKKIGRTAFDSFELLGTLNLEENLLEELHYSVLYILRKTRVHALLANNPWKGCFVCDYGRWCKFNNMVNTMDLNCTSVCE